MYKRFTYCSTYEDVEQQTAKVNFNKSTYFGRHQIQSLIEEGYHASVRSHQACGLERTRSALSVSTREGHERGRKSCPRPCYLNLYAAWVYLCARIGVCRVQSDAAPYDY